MPRKRPKPAAVEFSNLEKVFFPATSFTKGDLIKYYVDIAPLLLPHFRDRPVTLIRMPNGVEGERFYEKNAPGHTPDWVHTTHVPRSEGGVINYILVNDARTLAWCANNAAVEFHPFLHRAGAIDQPTHLAFDLDPGEGVGLLACIEVAFRLREVFDGLKLKAFPKVTGSKGLQLYVPLNTGVTYASATPFAKAVAELLHLRHPDLVVSDMSKALRVGKVFIDWSQNHEKKTTVGPYSVRGKRDEPFVSTPVTWQEIEKADRKGDDQSLFFPPALVVKRAAKLGDLFAPVLRLKQYLPDQFEKLAPKTRRSTAALAPYAAKRDFAKTPEPVAELPQRSAQGSRRRFVIQKHAASHLHFDFRLEMHEVLKSWAVPKGLPLEPGVARSAFATEDHPLEYFSFEGTIPEGEYGGGTVMVWDVGTYDVVEGNYWKGKITVFLTGRKLKGEWQLVNVSRDRSDKPRWEIEKINGVARPPPKKIADRSVLTNRTMDEIAAAKGPVWSSDRKPAARSEPSRPALNEARDTSAPAKGKTSSKRTPRRATSTPPPRFVVPMMAREVHELPEGDAWIYEIKLDGYRGLGRKDGAAVELISRNDKDLGKDFPSVVAALKTIRAENALLDGEVVALDEEGKPSFQLLQNRRTKTAAAIVYYAFDVLHVDGEDWRRRPLEERKQRLREIVEASEVRYSASFNGPADKVLAGVEEMALEGVVAKRRDSAYQAGERTGAWVKFKRSPEQEFVVGGYKRGSPLESLVVGYYEAGRLLCAGKVRQGLNPKNRRELFEVLQRLTSDVCPFANLPNSKKSHWGEGITAEQMKEIQWTIPRVVAQIRFVEWTSGDNLRHGTFRGLRTDKDPHDVVREA